YTVPSLLSDCSLSLSTLFPHFFFSNAPSPTETYTLSLHDALPISIEPLPNRRMPTFFCFAKTSSAGCLPTPRTVCSRHSTPYIIDRKSTRLNSSHVSISYAVFCLKKKKQNEKHEYTTQYKIQIIQQ